jgi:hypothetical protein
MGETNLTVGNEYLKVVLKTIQAHQGMGVTRLMLTLELSNRGQNSTGYPLWLGGRVEVQVRSGSRLHVGHLQPSTAQPINVGRFGYEAGTQLTLDLTNHQFWLLDENRTNGAVQMYLVLTGHALIDGQHIVVSEMQPFSHQINQSEWVEIVRQAGLKRVMLLELESPDPQAHPDLAQALDNYAQAQTRYAEGEWRLTVESIRQALASLVGKKADDEDQETDIEDAIKAANKQSHNGRLGYEPRRELVRRSAKFMADLGAHPEVAETRKHDAYAALMIAGGILHAFATQQ